MTCLLGDSNQMQVGGLKAIIYSVFTVNFVLLTIHHHCERDLFSSLISSFKASTPSFCLIKAYPWVFVFWFRYVMGKARVLILGHSFIRRLHVYITPSSDNGFTTTLGISEPEFICKWHGVGGRTIAKVLKYDLSVVQEFGPDVIVIQLGTNDLVDSSPLTVGSALETLVTILHKDYKVDVVCVCQTLRRSLSEFSLPGPSRRLATGHKMQTVSVVFSTLHC